MAQYNTIKPVLGYEGLYSVTDNGKVYSHKRNRFLKGFTCYSERWGQHNRHLVDLRKDNKTTRKFVHTLVYEAFYGEKPDYLEIDHIDGDKTNNHFTNLRAVTRSENMKYYYKKLAITDKVRLTNGRFA